MRKIYLIPLIILILIPNLNLFSQENYAWPLDAEKALTSTFGEYRVGHFHAGIDLKTWLKTGYDVYAIDSAYVWQVKTSVFGYGKVVYLKLKDDGKIIVYGHLSDFSDKIKENVVAEQKRLGRYGVRLFFDEDDIPIENGELIGFSGQTGSGGPHLHFEMRDAQNRPINPLKNNFSITDNIPPILKNLSITPLDHQSTVNDQHNTIILPCLVKGDRYYLADIPNVCGKFQFGISTFDMTEAASNVLGIYKAALFLDGEKIYDYSFDRFSYSNTNEISLIYDFGLWWNGHGKFYQLFRPKGAGTEVVSHHPIGKGILDSEQLSPGYHDVKIEVSDVNGNKSTLTFRILVTCPPKIELSHSQDSLYIEVEEASEIQEIILQKSLNGERWLQLDKLTSPNSSYPILTQPTSPTLYRAVSRDSFGVETFSNIVPILSETPQDTIKPVLDLVLSESKNFWELDVTSSEILKDIPKLTIKYANAAPTPINLTQLNSTSYRGTYPLTVYSDGFTTLEILGTDLAGNTGKYVAGFRVGVISHNQHDSFTSDDGNARLFVPHGAIFEDIFVRIEPEKIPMSNHVEQGLKRLTDVYTFLPDDVPFLKKARIYFNYPKHTKNLNQMGVYQWLVDGNWKRKGNILDVSKKRISAKVRNLGIFAVCADTLAPEIYNILPADGTIFQNYDPHIFAKVEDSGSGIGEDDVRIMLDNKQIIAEYDYQTYQVKGDIDWELAPGTHTLVIEAEDNAKNVTKKEVTFEVK